MRETRWTRALATTGLNPGACCVVRVEGREIALARLGDTFYALDNACPHSGGSLGDGYVVRDKISCPWHGWPFELATGAGPEGECVPVYPVRVTDGWVEIGL